jgi:hypothetical protein
MLDRDDANHKTCIDAAGRLPPAPLRTSWPCFVEAMYLLGSVGGFRYQAELWRLQTAGRLVLCDLTPGELGRMPELQDAPMDLADASLVAVAEKRSFHQVFTLDHHFRIYRLADGSVLDVIP